ncbi:ankyrin repeat-containing domain protein [Apodospora peruviana]|uniref:Ankyrin repeat-containing domain protein n=1 Tax=Apodospora peruviana TaxID=516989 RepID=A0AAE0IB72_9PEZI|nr:ankyrin repeat-containing domain protein [Apodospora peruviana]
MMLPRDDHQDPVPLTKARLLIRQAAMHATRPLRLLEMADLINVTQYPPESRNLSAVKELVRSACKLPLQILPDETISVGHNNVTESVTEATLCSPESTDEFHSGLEPGPAHNRLAVLCLCYLSSGSPNHASDVEPQGPFSWDYEDEQVPRLPFADYAAVNWPVHVQKASLLGHEQTEINEILDSFLTGKTFEQWIDVWNQATQNETIPHLLDNRSTPLTVAVQLGLTEYVKLLLSRPETDVNTGCVYSGSPLCWAARKGLEEIVRLLLAAGADASIRTRYGETPAILAASQNHPNIVKALVDAGVSPFDTVCLNNGCVEAISTTCHVSPITMAIEHGHLETVRVLSRYIETAEQANSALHAAVRYRRPSIVELLLQQHPGLIDINLELAGKAALYTACAYRDARTIRLLLNAGADPNLRLGRLAGGGRNPNNTPLHALVSTDSLWGYPRTRREKGTPENTIECLEMLIAAGADVDQVDDEGNSVLSGVTDPIVAGLLVDAGEVPNTTIDDDDSAYR